MALLRLDIQTTQRIAIPNGPFKANLFNDTIDELTTDLANLAIQWNLALVPLLAHVPDGTQDVLVNAYKNGLDARTEYVDWSADTSAPKVRYYNIPRSRPKTIKEALDDIYASMLGLGNTVNQTIVSGGLTDGQKAAIGAHIFDSLATSSPSSLDGLTQSNALNIEQIAKDLYGSGWVLNGDGNPILTNSVQAMVNALLVLHSGHWSDDITLAPDASSGGGSGGTLAASYIAGATSADQTMTITDADGGPVIVNGIRTSGAWTGTDVLKVQAGRTDVGGSETVLTTVHKSNTPLATDLTTNPHLSLTVQDSSTNAIKDVIQAQVSQYAGGAATAGQGVAIGFGGVTGSGSGGGYKGTGRIGAVILDPASSTYTTAIFLGGKGEGSALPAWDDGCNAYINSAGTTTNATPAVVLSIPIPNTTIRVFQGIAKINGSTSDGLNFKTWKINFALSTSLSSLNLSYIPEVSFDAGNGSVWDVSLAYSANNVNITVTGAASTNIKWRVMVELFGVNA